MLGNSQAKKILMKIPFLIMFALLTTAVPVISQEQNFMEKEQLKSFLSKLQQDSQHWMSSVSSIDVALISGPANPGTKVMENRRRACLNTLTKLQGAITALAQKNSLSNQIAVLNESTDASGCLSALQDVLDFQRALEPGDAAGVVEWETFEKWDNELTLCFKESAADETKIYDHMAALGRIVDSKINPDTLTKNSGKSAGGSR
jgi:hypothetical protein